MISPNFQEQTQNYLSKVSNIYNMIALTGLPERNRELHHVLLDKIFIKLTMQVAQSESFSQRVFWEKEQLALTRKGHDKDHEQAQLRTLQALSGRASEPPPAKTLSVADTLHQYHRLMIVGAPGSGKTTLMRWLAVTFAKQLQAQDDRLGSRFAQNRIPIVLELRRFVTRLHALAQSPATFSLADEISTFVGEDARFPHIEAGFIRETLANGQGLLLLDGLDEVPNRSARQRLLEAVEAFITTPDYTHNWCILTTRPHGFQQVNLRRDFQQAEVQPFTDEDVRHFMGHWYDTAYGQIDPDRATAEANELTTKIQENQNVQGLARNPLLCTIIAIVYRNNRILPHRRVELYEKCCEALLDTWERDKFGDDNVNSLLLSNQFSWKTKLYLLGYVAQWLHQTTERLAASEEQIEAQLVKGLEALQQKGTRLDKPLEEEAHNFVVAIRDRSGLLQGRGDGTLEFMHRTFQEYLTARFIAAQPREVCIDLVMTHLHEAWWREVHLLVIGHLGTDSGENAETASQLLLHILQVYKPPSRWLLPPRKKWQLRWFNLGKWLPSWQWQRRIAWHLLPEFELAAEGFADCTLEGRTELVSKTLFQVAEDRALLWLREPCLRGWVFPDDQFLSHFVKVVAKYLPSDSGLVDIFLQGLQDENEEVQRVAADRLGDLGVASETVISALVAALQDKESWARDTAAYSLGSMGATNDRLIQDLVDALVAALQDENESVRGAAADSLGRLGVASETVSSAL
ncbi:MAG TPA: NACHT domain-containing protein, partial [Thioploca sp.]|nr:NACHT domain-containing protein [Thioploca sp.]